jgi:hypothetical protein
MKPITLKEALLIYVNAVLNNSDAPSLYLKDEIDDYHQIDTIDLSRYGVRCDDGHWESYEYILEREKSGEGQILFVEEENNNEHSN